MSDCSAVNTLRKRCINIMKYLFFFLYHYIMSASLAHTLMFTRVKKLHVCRRSKEFDGMLIYLSTINVTQFVWFYHRNHFPSSWPTGPVKILSKQGIAAED